ncbi:L-lactate dehydrogenase, partial [Candidatus Falkowbacteria bacterium]|nr:L-lactate dehydrogenase [Candidatus Falkowbacteria bacterium]
MEYRNKVTIIGAGMVGSTTAYSLIANDLTEEIALVDVNQTALRAQVMDLQHSVPFSSFTKVKMGSYDDLKDSRVAVITAGAAQKPGESRLDLVKKNSAIMKKIVPDIFKKNSDIIILMITNPVDILAYLAIKMFPKKKNQIIGSGTVLDSARFRVALGQRLKVNPNNVHGYIVGEHGDSEVPLWSTVDIGNTPLDEFKKISASEKNKIFNSAKNAAYAIIKGKQSTYYAIASGATLIIRSILYDQQTVLPVSRLMEGEYGIRDICLSLPAVIGRKGIVHKLKPGISKEEIK